MAKLANSYCVGGTIAVNSTFILSGFSVPFTTILPSAAHYLSIRCFPNMYFKKFTETYQGNVPWEHLIDYAFEETIISTM